MSKKHGARNRNCQCAMCMDKQFQQKLEKNIKEKGWSITGVMADRDTGEPAFAYTTGRTESCKGAELIFIGGSDQVQCCTMLIATLYRLKEDSTACDNDEVLGVIGFKIGGTDEDAPLGCRTITNTARAKFLLQAVARYGKDGFTAKQLVLPDDNGRLPWHDGFDESKSLLKQPLLYKTRK
jgi:hypothetical protein